VPAGHSVLTSHNCARAQELSKKRKLALHTAVNRVSRWVLYTALAFAAYAEFVHGGAPHTTLVVSEREPRIA
jgi:hypothetical protein